MNSGPPVHASLYPAFARSMLLQESVCRSSRDAPPSYVSTARHEPLPEPSAAAPPPPAAAAARRRRDTPAGGEAVRHRTSTARRNIPPTTAHDVGERWPASGPQPCARPPACLACAKTRPAALQRSRYSATASPLLCHRGKARVTGWHAGAHSTTARVQVRGGCGAAQLAWE